MARQLSRLCRSAGRLGGASRRGLPAGPAGGRLPGEGRSPRGPAARRLAAPRARASGVAASGGGLEAGGDGSGRTPERVGGERREARGRKPTRGWGVPRRETRGRKPTRGRGLLAVVRLEKPSSSPPQQPPLPREVLQSIRTGRRPATRPAIGEDTRGAGGEREKVGQQPRAARANRPSDERDDEACSVTGSIASVCTEARKKGKGTRASAHPLSKNICCSR